MERNDDIEMALVSGISAFEAKQFSRAMGLLAPLAESGEVEAIYRCAVMCQNGLGTMVNQEQAFLYMKQAAEQGHALAQHGLGFMYFEGDCVKQNGTQAVHWFALAAEQGLVGSQMTLAMIYEEGKLVEADSELASYWSQRAQSE